MYRDRRDEPAGQHRGVRDQGRATDPGRADAGAHPGLRPADHRHRRRGDQGDRGRLRRARWWPATRWVCPGCRSGTTRAARHAWRPGAAAAADQADRPPRPAPGPTRSPTARAPRPEPVTVFEAKPMAGKDLGTDAQRRAPGTRREDAGRDQAGERHRGDPALHRSRAGRRERTGEQGPVRWPPSGRIAPGSTFKVVEPLALLRAGLKPHSSVKCPRDDHRGRAAVQELQRLPERPARHHHAADRARPVLQHRVHRQRGQAERRRPGRRGRLARVWASTTTSASRPSSARCRTTPSATGRAAAHDRPGQGPGLAAGDGRGRRVGQRRARRCSRSWSTESGASRRPSR